MQTWHGPGSNLVPAWYKPGTGLGRTWDEPGTNLGRTWDRPDTNLAGDTMSRTTYLLTLPERLVRSALGLTAGVAREVGNAALPDGVRKTQLYRNLVDATLRFVIEQVGGVEGVYAAGDRLPDDFLVRRTAGNAIEALGIVAFRASPVWVLAALADVCGAGRQLIPEIADALKAEGLLENDREFTSVDQLLDGLERTSSRLAATVNTPPLDVAALRAEWNALRAEARTLPTPALPSADTVSATWMQLKSASVQQARSVFEVSTTMALVAAKRTTRVLRSALLEHYRSTLRDMGRVGYVKYTTEHLRPYVTSAVRQFSPARPTLTERLLNRFRAGSAVMALVLLASPEAAQLRVITGRVVAQDDSAFPMRGARVELVGSAATADPVFTDADGRFALGVPVPATLRITKAGYAPAVRTVEDAPREVELRLERGAIIVGRVTDELGFPVTDAVVRMRPLNPVTNLPGVPTEFSADTDDNGEFRIGSLGPGRYSVHTERRALGADSMNSLFVLTREAQLRREQQIREASRSKPLSDVLTVDIGTGETSVVALRHHERAVIPPDAPIGGAVTGTVVDQFGEPVDDLVVRLWRLRYSDGGQIAEPTRFGRRVNDRGDYRFFHVLPGRYLVVVHSEDLQHAPVYYPDVTAIASASPVIVGRRQEVPGVHVVFRRVRHAHLSGILRGPAAGPQNSTVSLIAVGAVTLPPIRSGAGDDGFFEFHNVVPGEYIVQAHRGQELGFRRVNVVEGENPPVAIAMTPTAAIAGRVTTDDGRPLPSGLRLMALLEPEHRPLVAASTTVAADGRFEIRGLLGPTRFVIPAGQPGARFPGQTRGGYRLKSVQIGPVNAAEAPVLFESDKDSRDDVSVVLSSDAATIVGRVTDDDGAEPDDYRVLVFPLDRSRWFTGSPYVQLTAGPDVNGRYAVPDLPPGEYWVVALDVVEGDATSGEWQTSELLSALIGNARRVSLPERQNVTADLRLTRRAR